MSTCVYLKYIRMSKFLTYVHKYFLIILNVHSCYPMSGDVCKCKKCTAMSIIVFLYFQVQVLILVSKLILLPKLQKPKKISLESSGAVSIARRRAEGAREQPERDYSRARGALNAQRPRRQKKNEIRTKLSNSFLRKSPIEIFSATCFFTLFFYNF